jgi:hypothetical protein
MSAAGVYFFITALSYPFIALYDASAALYRATGNSRLPMLVTLGRIFLHIAVNAVFIFVMQLGVEGAPFQRSCPGSRAAAMLLFQRRPGQDITFDRIRGYMPDFRVLKMILFIAAPAGVENCLFQLGKLMVAEHGIDPRYDGHRRPGADRDAGVVSIHAEPCRRLGLVTVAGYCMGGRAARRPRGRISSG